MKLDIGATSATRSGHPKRSIAGEPSAVIMQPTTFCNLDCSYCYLPGRDRKNDMPVDVARAVAAGLAPAWPTRGRLEIVWHGGEPLATGRAQLVELFGVFEPLRQAGRIQHVLQTNATLIDDAWCEVFTAFEVTVGVSIDGPELANRYRVDRRGRPAFTRIRDGIETLKRHGLGFTVISVVSNDSSTDAAEILDFLDGLGCPFAGFNMEEREGVNTDAATPSMEQARRFWRDVVTWAAAHRHIQVRELWHLLTYLALDEAGRAANGLHDLIPTVGVNGDVVVLSPELLGARDERYGDFVAGNVLAEPLDAILERAPDLAYVKEFAAGIEGCEASCDFFAYCQGSHAGNRYFEHGTFTATETEHCRTMTQALVLAVHDVAYPTKEETAA